MKIGIIRLHRWVTAGTFVYDKLAEFVDGLFFCYNDLCSDALFHMAANHSQTIDMRKDSTDWKSNSHLSSGHLSLQRCMRWADEIKPSVVYIFDEDQAPPDRMQDEFIKWMHSGKDAVCFKWVWCWDDVDTIITERPCPCGWFAQGYKWRPGISDIMPISGDYLPGLSRYKCRYPGRNLGVMNEQIRDWRTQKKMGWWLNEPFQTGPYDPDLTVKDMYSLWPK